MMAFSLDRSMVRTAVGRFYEQPIARALIFLRVGPNTVTLFGLALACVTAYLIAIDHLVWGGVMLLVSAGLDSIDGAVARLSGKASAAGALLDSVVDRVSEGVVLFGVLWLAMDRGDDRLVFLTYVAFGASMMVSYVVARAQGLGAPAAVGLMSRPERVLALAAGLLTGYLLIGVAFIAAFAPVTALHRLLYGWTTLRKGGGES